MPARTFIAPDISLPDGIQGNPAMLAFLNDLVGKLQQTFSDLEEISRTRDVPGGNRYDITTAGVTYVRTIDGTATTTATSSDASLYQLVREFKQKGFIR